jgi:hypothetical protein
LTALDTKYKEATAKLAIKMGDAIKELKTAAEIMPQQAETTGDGENRDADGGKTSETGGKFVPASSGEIMEYHDSKNKIPRGAKQLNYFSKFNY